MFRPLEMSRVELAVSEQDIVAVTEALAASEAFHPTRTDQLSGGSGPNYGEKWEEKVPIFTSLEQRIQTVMEALDVDEGPPPSETPHLIEPDLAQRDVSRLEQEAQAPARELEEELCRLSRLRSQIKQLQTIAGLEVDVDELRHMRYTFVLLGTMPVANVERLQTSLELIPSVLVTLRRDNHLATVALFGTQRDAEILNRAARSAYLNPLKLPETVRGTPVEAIAALEESIKRTRLRITEYEATLERLHQMRVDHLRHLLWRVRASRTLAETIARYGRLRYTYLIAGWVPTSKLPQLEQRIKEVSEQIVVEVEKPSRKDSEHIPVALENPPPVRPFQDLVTNYGHPKYGEMDPTLMMTLTFPLIFGIMFGDIGHGLVLALLGLLLTSRAVRALQGLAGLGPLLIYCGVASTIFGFLYGSIFGLEEALTPLWTHPMENIMDILMATVAIGTLLLNLGMVLNVVNAALDRRWGHVLFDHNGLAGMMLYWSLIGLVVQFFTDNLPFSAEWLFLSAAVSGLAVTFSEVLENLVEGRRPLIEDETSTYLIQLPIEIFETVITMMSNTLSYVRMGAFAVGHGALGMVVFIMAEIVGPAHGPAYWTVVALGNLFVIGFEGMIVGIQTLRLEYYEFFSKFFSGGGMRYRPLSLIPRER
ncbi:MAG: hypothetical protein DRI48_03275 [Chloroflexi bacterium]|nr:MAG: hypothetical protein DRI48_03275 [Chloroflexota bacterium]